MIRPDDYYSTATQPSPWPYCRSARVGVGEMLAKVRGDEERGAEKRSAFRLRGQAREAFLSPCQRLLPY